MANCWNVPGSKSLWDLQSALLGLGFGPGSKAEAVGRREGWKELTERTIIARDFLVKAYAVFAFKAGWAGSTSVGDPLSFHISFSAFALILEKDVGVDCTACAYLDSNSISEFYSASLTRPNLLNYTHPLMAADLALLSWIWKASPWVLLMSQKSVFS